MLDDGPRKCPFHHLLSTAADNQERLAMPAVVASVARGENPSGAQPKQDYMAILAKVIAAQWKEVMRLRSESPECLGLMTTPGQGAGESIPLSDPSVRGQIEVLRGAAPEIIARNINLWMIRTLRAGFDELEFRTALLTPDESVRLSGYLTQQVGRSGATNLSRALAGGVSTALTAVWGIMGALPELFVRMGEPRPDVATLEQATEAVFKVCQTLAREHFHVFVGTLVACQKGPEGVAGNAFTIYAQNLTLKRDNRGRLEVGISERVAERVIAHLVRKAEGERLPTTGCPALFAHGEISTVIPELLQWVAEVARKYYFPQVVEYMAIATADAPDRPEASPA